MSKILFQPWLMLQLTGAAMARVCSNEGSASLPPATSAPLLHCLLVQTTVRYLAQHALALLPNLGFWLLLCRHRGP